VDLVVYLEKLERTFKPALEKPARDEHMSREVYTDNPDKKISGYFFVTETLRRGN